MTESRRPDDPKPAASQDVAGLARPQETPAEAVSVPAADSRDSIDPVELAEQAGQANQAKREDGADASAPQALAPFVERPAELKLFLRTLPALPGVYRMNLPEYIQVRYLFVRGLNPHDQEGLWCWDIPVSALQEWLE